MKLFGLYQHDDIPSLEANHRRFCDENGIAYQKHRIANYWEKFRLIYHLLQEYPNETLLFIDSNSYFTTFAWQFDLDRDLLLQKKTGGILHNFIVLRSTVEVQQLFKEHILPASSVQMFYRNNWKFELPIPSVPELPNKWLLPYPFEQNGVHLNIDAFAHFDDASVMVRHIILDWLMNPPSFANLLCDYKPASYPINMSPFEIINPGHGNALVTLHTKEMERIGSISEQNVADYCERNDITYYIYRQIPENLSHLSGAWCKPYLLLDHIADHDTIGWIDSDILITTGYRMDFSGEVQVYNDPGDWYFNSGFMIFKNTEKNKSLLQGVIHRCDQLEQRHITHVNGGDQRYFNQEYRSHYPDLPPLSNLVTNCLPGYFFPHSEEHLLHFMGIGMPIRAALMDVYAQKIKASIP